MNTTQHLSVRHQATPYTPEPASAYLRGSSLYSLPPHYFRISPLLRPAPERKIEAVSSSETLFELLSSLQDIDQHQQAPMPAPAVAPPPETLSPFAPRILLMAGLFSLGSLFSGGAFAQFAAGDCNSGTPNCQAQYNTCLSGCMGDGTCNIQCGSWRDNCNMACEAQCQPNPYSGYCEAAALNNAKSLCQTGAGEIGFPPAGCLNTAPWRCEAGTRIDGMSCTTCLAGTFTSEANQNTCAACSAGQYNTSPGSTGCLDCGPGHYSTGVSCDPCPAGQISMGLVMSCTTCVAGTHANPEQTACVPDPAPNPSPAPSPDPAPDPAPAPAPSPDVAPAPNPAPAPSPAPDPAPAPSPAPDPSPNVAPAPAPAVAPAPAPAVAPAPAPAVAPAPAPAVAPAPAPAVAPAPAPSVAPAPSPAISEDCD